MFIALRFFIFIFLCYPSLGLNVGNIYTLATSNHLEYEKMKQNVFGREGGMADIELGKDPLMSDRLLLVFNH